jgi:hypothetical protein
MRHCWFIPVLFLLPAPLFAQAVWTPASPAPTAAPGPQSVEEPDAPDEDSDKEMQGSQIPGQSEIPAVKPPSEVKPPQAAGEEGDSNYDRVELQGLNKVTARAQTIDAPIGSVVRFGTIEIVAHSCWKSAPEERPENAALLEISEIKQGEAPRQIFLGWMFSSSPGLSALEHPFYDVTVVGCDKAKAEASPPPAPVPPAKPAVRKKAP